MIQHVRMEYKKKNNNISIQYYEISEVGWKNASFFNKN